MYSDKVKLFPYFKDVFRSYEDFRDWYINIPLSTNGYVPNEVTFCLIAYEYNDCQCSMQEEEFKQHFSIDLYTYSKEFEATTKALDELMSLKDDDIAISGETIVNIADIPETAYSTSSETVNFLSNQQKTIGKKGYLQVKKEQLSNKRAYTVRTFLKRFKHLFLKVIDNYYTPVIEENSEQ